MIPSETRGQQQVAEAVEVEVGRVAGRPLAGANRDFIGVADLRGEDQLEELLEGEREEEEEEDIGYAAHRVDVRGGEQSGRSEGDVANGGRDHPEEQRDGRAHDRREQRELHAGEPLRGACHW